MKDPIEIIQLQPEERLDYLNHASKEQLKSLFHQVCHSDRWASELAQKGPFESLADLKQKGATAWDQCGEPDWKDSLNGHPRIGDKAKKSGLSAAWSKKEQSKASTADSELMTRLKDSQEKYFQKFGFIFLICATGKSTQEILDAVLSRLENDGTQELQNVAREQAKINQLRLEKLIKE